MARALSHVHSVVRGSVGGLTYFSNQFHQICMRSRTAPVQPNTSYQTGIRSAFDYAESAWEAMSDLERGLWQNYADTCVYPGPLGPYTVPGRQLMIGTLALAKYAHFFEPLLVIPNDLAPKIPGWFTPGVVAAGVYEGLEQGIAIDIPIPAGRHAVAVSDVSPAFNLTRNRYKGPWLSPAKTVSLCTPDATTHIDIERPLQTIDNVVFSRTRIFTASEISPPLVGHALAFAIYLRHIVHEAAPPNGNDKPKNRPKTKKKPA